MNLLDCCQHAEAAFFADSLKLIICKQNIFLTLSDLAGKNNIKKKIYEFRRKYFWQSNRDGSIIEREMAVYTK